MLLPEIGTLFTIYSEKLNVHCISFRSGFAQETMKVANRTPELIGESQHLARHTN